MDHETLPPCPRADCDADREWAAHHWHWKSDGAADHTHRVCTNYCEFDTQECTRCYSAHVPNVSESPTGSPTAGFVPVAERDLLRARLDAVLAAASDAARDIGNDTGSDVECYGDDYWRGMVMAASRILGDVRRAAEGVE